MGLTARTDAWLNRFAMFISNPSLIASLFLLTRNWWPKFRSVLEYIGVRASRMTPSTTRFPLAGSRCIRANVPRCSKYWQLEVVETTGMHVDIGVPEAKIWFTPNDVSIPNHFKR